MLRKRLASLTVACFLVFAASAAVATAAETYTTITRVKFRTGPSLDAAVIRILDTGTAVEVEEYDAENWSKVVVGGVSGYMKSEYLIPSHVVEPLAAVAPPAEGESNPDAPEGGEPGSAYKTTTRVKFRTGPSLDAAVIKTLDTGTAVKVEEYDAENWSKVVVGGVSGYVKSEYLIQAVESLAAVVPPAEGESNPDTPEGGEPGSAYKTTTRVNFRTGPSLDAAVIKKLNQGVTLEMLAYDPAEWSNVAVDGVTGYVKSEYIISADQYTARRGDVELLEWPAVKSILPLHRPLTVTDVRSGVTYTVQSFSNGLHADVEPLTKDDTAALLQTYGGKWKWDPRPVWVSFNGRTFAASINGMPHGGGTIAGNGMNGQVCLHFLGSKPHNGNKAFERDHQAGVMEAFNAAK